MTRTACPTDELLRRYSHADLDDATAATVDAHIAECPACVARLDALTLVNGDGLLAALRVAPADTPSEFEREVVPHLGRTRPIAAELLVGAELNGYRLLAPIGSGGMGRVYRARHARLEQDVAVKVVAPGVDSEQVRTRFEAERHALALMDHPNISRVIDGGVSADGRPFFVMELVDGVPITTYCDQKRLSVRDRLGLVITVCQAIQHAHQKGIIHRDLKPTNVLVTEYDGRPVPKVIDFGVAKAVGPRPAVGKTEFGTVVGTPEYMSPEQAGLDSLDVDTRADVFALGVLLYELLTGDTPLARGRLREAPLLDVLRLVRDEEAPSPSTRLAASDDTLVDVAAARAVAPAGLRRQLRGDLDWIVLKALDKDRARRYESATALADDIGRHMRHEPVLAGPPSAGYRLRKFMRRNRGAVVAAGIVFVALVGGATAATVGMVHARNARNDANAAASAAMVDRDVARLARNEADAAAKAAMTDRDIANAVRTFFQDDLLRQASGRRQMKAGFVPQPDLKVRELLDRSSRRIAGRFDAHPLVEAAIRHTMGDAYREIGVYPSAREHLVRTVELYHAEAGPDDSSTLEAETSLVALQITEGVPGAAVSRAERVYEVRRRTLGDDDPRTLEAANHLGGALTGGGQHRRADAVYQEALERERRLFGEGSPEVLETMSHLAVLWKVMHGPKRAEPVFREVYDRRRKDLGAENIDTLHVARSLAGALIDLHRFDDADRLLSESLPVLKRTLGPEHAETLSTRRARATLHSIRDGGKAGLAELAEVVDTMGRTFGAEHPETLLAQHHLGSLQLRAGERDAAEKLFTTTLEAQQRVLGKEHPHALTTASDLGAAYAKLNRWEQANQILTDTLAVQRRVLGENRSATLNTASELANARIGRGDFKGGIALLRETVVARRQHPADMRNLGELKTLGLIEQRNGRAPEAAAAFTEWLERVKDVPVRIEPVRIAEIQAGLGLNRLRQKKLTDAEAALRESLANYAKQPGTWEEHYFTAFLGYILLEQKKYADAEPLLLAGHKELEKMRAKLTVDGQAALDASRRFLAKLYELKGEPKKAAEYKQRP